MKKRKAAIVTLTVANHGNRLQNLATQWVFEKFGFDTETLHNPYDPSYSELKHRVVNLAKCLVGNKRQRMNARREFSFEQFDRDNIKYSRFWLNNPKHVNKLNDLYDCFVCGSDQLWNPTTLNYGANNFAMFADARKKVTMAPSFGVVAFPNEREEEYRNYLNSFQMLSVREKSGQDIICRLTGRASNVVIDPTLMISREQWEKIAIKPKWLGNEKYILCYVLGDQYMLELVQEIADKRSYKVINLMDAENERFYCCNPSHFLYLIQHCELMVTDSFHGSVFTFLFERPLVVMERKDGFTSMNTRLDNLLNLFKLDDRRSSEVSELKFFQADYEESYRILKTKREEAFSFLRKALVSINEN